MSRKDYVRMAQIIATERTLLEDGESYGGIGKDGLHLLRNLTISLAETFKSDNPRFDRQRFYDATGQDIIA